MVDDIQARAYIISHEKIQCQRMKCIKCKTVTKMCFSITCTHTLEFTICLSVTEFHEFVK